MTTTKARSGARNGRCKRMRDYITANPKCSASEIAAAIGAEFADIKRDLSRMTKAGILVREDSTPFRYSTGRALKCNFFLSDAEKAAQRLTRIRKGNLRAAERKRAERQQVQVMAQQAESRSKCNDALTVVKVRAPVDHRKPQTVEDFLAQGGQIERLPSMQAPPAYGRKAA